MVFGRKHRKKEISGTKRVLNNLELQPEQSVVYLGVTLDDQLKWDDHVMKLRSKCFGGLAKLRRLWDLPMTVRKKVVLCAHIATYGLLQCGVAPVDTWARVKGGNDAEYWYENHLRSAKVSNWHWNETETAMEHPGSEEEALCTKAAPQMHSQNGTNIPPQQVSEYIKPDKQTRRSSLGKLYLSRTRTDIHKKIILLLNFGILFRPILEY